MRTLANLAVKPCISPGSLTVGLLTGHAIVNGNWIGAALTFAVGLLALGVIALAADRGHA